MQEVNYETAVRKSHNEIVKFAASENTKFSKDRSRIRSASKSYSSLFDAKKNRPTQLNLQTTYSAMASRKNMFNIYT